MPGRLASPVMNAWNAVSPEPLMKGINTMSASVPLRDVQQSEALHTRIKTELEKIGLNRIVQLTILEDGRGVIVEGHVSSFHERQCAIACVRRTEVFQSVTDRLCVHRRTR